MRNFDDFNPVSITIYFISITAVIMFSKNPLLLLTAFLGITAYSAVSQKRAVLHAFRLCIPMYLVLTLINPFLYHNGKTVLFIFNDMPFTLEALVCGAVSSGIIVTVILWFRLFSLIMSADRLMYVTGILSPGLSLVISMSVRYVSLFKIRLGYIRDTQKALGLYKKDNIFNTVKSDLRIFSILITWSLENGIITARSMNARGYGKNKRTSYRRFRFTKADSLLTAAAVLCSTVTFTSLICGSLNYEFYPSLSGFSASPSAYAGCAAYGILSLLPLFIELEEKIRWKYLRSKI